MSSGWTFWSRSCGVMVKGTCTIHILSICCVHNQTSVLVTVNETCWEQPWKRAVHLPCLDHNERVQFISVGTIMETELSHCRGGHEMTQDDTQSLRICGEGKSRGKTANTGWPGKIVVKMAYVCVPVYVSTITLFAARVFLLSTVRHSWKVMVCYCFVSVMQNSTHSAVSWVK